MWYLYKHVAYDEWESYFDSYYYYYYYCLCVLGLNFQLTGPLWGPVGPSHHPMISDFHQVSIPQKNGSVAVVVVVVRVGYIGNKQTSNRRV